jgi:subtilisin family serine protease
MNKKSQLWLTIILCYLLVLGNYSAADSFTRSEEAALTGEIQPSETATNTLEVFSPTTDVIVTTATQITPEVPYGIITADPNDPALYPVEEIREETRQMLVGTTHLYSNERVMATGAGVEYDAVAIELEKIGVKVLNVPVSQFNDIRKELKKDSGIMYAEPDGEVSALDVFPNDPGFGTQYGLINICAPQGWQISTGSQWVTIAIVDSGVDGSHSDLVMKVLPGFDFVEGDPIPQDEFGHGTHISGIAAASTNNGNGVSGVSWGAQILPVRVLDASGNGSYAALAAGIIWAADHGAQIINLSLGGTSPNTTLERAVNYAVARGALMVAASGNDGTGSLRYPANYDPVLSVGSVNSINQRSASSNYGSGLDVVAPGEDIYSTNPGGGYGYRSGTSMSAPYVSGLAAVLWGMPGYGRANTVSGVIRNTSLDLGDPGWDVEYGFGIIQMDAALGVYITQPEKENTPPPLYPAAFSATPNRTDTPTPTVSPLMAFTPTASPTESESVSGMSMTNSPDVEEPTLTPSSTVEGNLAEGNQTGGEQGGSPLLLISGLCFILGGSVLMIYLVLLRKRNN